MDTEFDPHPLTDGNLSTPDSLLSLELHSDQVVLCFQPVYGLETGRVVHNEVLVRWQTPQGELLPSVQDKTFETLTGKGFESK
ncbi:MAG: EAL domain-containing protein [Synechocystis sp.]|nr:EAL domain-containing protein [Synechocystis sp.]